MTTTTLSSKPGRFRPQYQMVLRRNLGNFGLICALIFLFYPVQFLQEITRNFALSTVETNSSSLPVITHYNLYGGGLTFTSVSIFFFSVLMILLPFVLSLIFNSYMHSKKAVDVYHSLPIRRETLLYTNAAVAMTILSVPVVLSDLVIAIVSTIKFGFSAQRLGEQFVSMFGWLICAFAIYAITTLVVVLCGTVFDSMLYSGILLHAVPILNGLFMLLCSLFLMGYAVTESRLPTLLLQSPTLTMIHRLVATSDGLTSMGDWEQQMYSNNNIALVIWLVLGVLAILAAARLYRNRHSELAEMTGLNGPLQIAVKLIGTVACAVPAGLMFYAISGEESKLVYLLWLTIGGLVSYTVLDVILHRGFKNMRRRLRMGGLTVGAVVLSSVAILYGGGIFYENKVPSTNQIYSVTIQGAGGYAAGSNMVGEVINFRVGSDGSTGYSTEPVSAVLTDPEMLQMISAFHQDVITRDFVRQEKQGHTYDETGVYANVRLKYQLKNGKQLERTYNRMSAESLKLLLPLETNAEFMKQTDSLFVINPQPIARWEIQDYLGQTRSTISFSQQDNARLVEAMRADMLARTQEQLERPSASPLAALTFYTRPVDQRNDIKAGILLPQQDQGSFYVNPWDTNTVAFLSEKNLLPAAVDLSNCYGVIVELNNAKYSRTSGSSTLIAQLSPDYSRFYPQELTEQQQYLQSIQKELDQFTGDERIKREMYWPKYNLQVFTQPSEIAALASQVRSTARADEIYLVAKFFLQDGSTPASAVLIPLSALTPELQAQFLENEYDSMG